MPLDKKRILEIKSKIQSKQNLPTTEEATKQWLIMPVLVALGYDPYSSDIIPEYTLDVGVKNGEKVDYALQINNQPVVLVECKQFNTQLSDKHISQLYRYFTVSDVNIAILTNGDDYLFFTDSQKQNIMDLEPYFKIKMSEITDRDIKKLEIYSREMIQNADVSQFVQYERFQTECKELITGLKTNNIPSWLLKDLAERTNIQNIDRTKLAEYLYAEVKRQFLQDSASKNTKGFETLQQIANGGMNTSYSNGFNGISNIKLNHYYVFNDHSDGSWKFHKISKALIFGNEYNIPNAKALLIIFITQLFETGKITRDSILAQKQFNRNYAINAIPDGMRQMKYIDKYDIYVETALSMESIMRFIEKLCDFANVPYDNIKLSFKE